jgi:hypothetical protein
VPVSPPPLSASQIEYLESASSILVGSATTDRVPEGVRGVGVRVLPGGERVEVLVPEAVASRTLANLAENPQLSITTGSLPTFSTIQVKGRLAAIRDGDARDHALALAFQPRFAAEFAWAGEAITRVARIAVWPCKVLELAIENIYTEAPAPMEFPKP